MANYEEIRTFPGKSANDCYAAIQRTYPKVKFEIWKKRDIAWLVIAKRKEGASEIDSNASAGFGNPTPITYHLSTPNMDESALKAIADEFFLALEAELK